MKAANTFKIPSLDGIRALSFLIVFISHDRLEQVPGLFGVAVFFFLSGYLITTLMRMEIEATGDLSIRNFFFRRAFRILPPFYLVLLLILGIVAAGWLPGTHTTSDLLASLFYITNYWNIYVRSIMMPGFNIFWSLAVEEHFYLIFPMVVLLMLRFRLRRRVQAGLLLGICGVVLLWRCILVFKLHSLDMTFGPVKYPLRTMYATDTRLDSILFGCVLALWGNPILDKKPRHSWLASGLGLVMLLATFIIRTPEFRETFRYTLQGLALMPLFISAIRLHDHWAFKWLNSAPLQFMGVLSYTLYLVHFPILNLVEKWSDNRLIVGISALALSVAIAYAMHLLVERPMANLRKRFGSRTAEVIESIRDTNGVTADQSPPVATRLQDGRRAANAIVRYDDWKQQLETERGS
jgi:peptidoglycan/LPS O-acetylase OafA/YrhL